MRSLLPLAFGCLLVAACSSEADPIIVEEPPPEAVCGNGTLELGEVCDGALAAADSCVARGFADGQLACSAECQVDVSACILQDEDGDGLLYQDEVAAGSDPTNFDTDGDGIGDGTEVTNGADPLNLYSWPTGVWPNRLTAAQEAGLVPEGHNLGQVPPNITVIDQFGNNLELHQLYGYVVVMSVGAVWCPPCNEAAQGSEALAQEFLPEGVIFVEVLVDGQTPGVDATQADIDGWLSSYGITFPVVRHSVRSDFSHVEALPTFFIYGRDMRVANVREGWGGDAQLSADITQVINASE